MGPSVLQFGGSLLFMHTPFNAELPNFHVVTHMGGAHLRVSHAPPQMAGVPALPNFGVPSIHAYTLCHRTAKFDVNARGGRACILG